MDAEVIKPYARDLKSLLEEADIVESKAFLRSFIKRIEIAKNQAVVHYSLPMPYGEDTQAVEVLPMVILLPEMGKGGLEPPRIAAPDPKSGPSANSGTPPRYRNI